MVQLQVQQMHLFQFPLSGSLREAYYTILSRRRSDFQFPLSGSLFPKLGAAIGAAVLSIPSLGITFEQVDEE